jgi:hypothetical protein
MPAEIFNKRSFTSEGIQHVVIGSGPYIQDIGAALDLSDIGEPTSLLDEWHKNIVTDLTDDDILVIGDVHAVVDSYLSNIAYMCQNILFPVSSRHIVKTRDGALHAVVSYALSGINRVFYLKSVNGGRSWTSTIVDPDDGMSYITASITCDEHDGIHIIFSREDNFISDTYWLYDGADTPTGFEAISDSEDYHFKDRFLFGGTALYSSLDYNNDHQHGYTVEEAGIYDSGNKCGIIYASGSSYSTGCNFHHNYTLVEFGSASHIPPYRTLRALRYHGIPYYLPAGIIIPFDQAVPAGFTRYSAQDGYHVRFDSAIGNVGGATEHRHRIVANASGYYPNAYCGDFSGVLVPNKAHNHTFDFYTEYAPNLVPSYYSVFGRVDSTLYSIPSHSLLLMSNALSLSYLTSLSQSGESLFEKSLIGASSYGPRSGGDITHIHPEQTAISTSSSGYKFCTDEAYPSDEYWPTAGAVECSHQHRLKYTFTSANSLPAYVLPYIYHVDSPINCNAHGSDLFYVYISPEGVASSPVNVSQIRTFYPSLEGSVLVDDNDDVHVIYSSQGINSPLGDARICYKKKTSSGWQPRVDFTTSDHMLYPSIDIDFNGDVHASWFNCSTFQSIQYRKCVSGSWQAIEYVDTSSYVGYPSNIIVDPLGNVYVVYLKWSDPETQIKEVYYSKRTSSGWSPPVNLSPGKAAAGYNQSNGQVLVDNKGNVVVTFTGKGYGAHASVYHPVYRYITPEDVVIPDLSSDAVDLFPDDDTEIIYPTVFWHPYPLSDSVYQNLVVSGFAFMYLYNPRKSIGDDLDTADIKFFASPHSLVGDSGHLGDGGLSDTDLPDSFVPVISGLLQQETYTVSSRGHIEGSHIRSVGVGKSAF